MKDSEIFPFCHKKGIRLPNGWRHCCNAVRFHNREETERHFSYKSKIAFELMKRGQTVFTEIELVNWNGSERPVADIFWLDENIIVELESQETAEKTALKMKQYGNYGLFVFDISKFSVEEILAKIGLSGAK